MTDYNMDHLKFLEAVAAADVVEVRRKEATYMGSWKRSGGRSAWFMLKRKIDRLAEIMKKPGDMPQQHEPARWDGFKRGEATPADVMYLAACYNAENIFAKIRDNPSGQDGTALAEVRDLRRYLILVEAEMMARGVVPPLPSPVSPVLPEGK